jgi:putative transposase
MATDRRRRRAEPTDDWGQLELLCGWPEQRDYELIRPMVLFGSPASERAKETGAASERSLQRRAARFEAEGMESLFGSEAAKKRKRLPPSVRRLIVDLKAEHPALNPNEIAAICYVRFGRRPDRKTVKRVLAEEPVPLRMVRRFAPYHEIEEAVQRRRAVVALHAEGWSAKAIAGYLRVGTSTVYRTLKRWVEEGLAGLEDRPHGRPPGVRGRIFSEDRNYRQQTSPLNVRRIGGVAMAGKPALASVPVTQEPYRNRDCEDSRAHSFCHAKYTHVSQTLWRGLGRRR